MTPLEIIILIISLLVGSSLLFMVVLTFAIAWNVYHHTIVRKTKDMWTREKCSEPGNNLQQQMWDEGLIWGENNKQYKKDVSITRSGLNLCGEFFDFGFDKTVIILGGRRETACYSYYYAYPYKDMGINVLCIDQRAHGLSEGKYATAGIEEAQDCIEWIKFLTNTYYQKDIYIHGTCVGSCSAMMVAIDNKCPKEVKGLVLDSPYVNYLKIYKRHYVESGHAVFPVYYQIWFWFRWYTKHNVKESTPINFINKVKLPCLFLCGEKDPYCSVEEDEMLFKTCGSENKKIIYFSEGSHSHVRQSDIAKYDNALSEFYNSILTR